MHNRCEWTGYQLVSDNNRDDEGVCPKCGSTHIEVINEEREDRSYLHLYNLICQIRRH